MCKTIAGRNYGRIFVIIVGVEQVVGDIDLYLHENFRANLDLIPII